MQNHPPIADAGIIEMISFDVRDQAFCIAIDCVREIRCWTPATPIPQAPDYMCGVVNLRGSVLPILDLGAKLNFGRTTPTARHAIVVVQVGTLSFGLLVDSVNEIVSARVGDIQAVPDLGGQIESDLVSGILPVDDRMITLIRLERLVDSAADLAA